MLVWDNLLVDSKAWGGQRTWCYIHALLTKVMIKTVSLGNFVTTMESSQNENTKFKDLYSLTQVMGGESESF